MGKVIRSVFFTIVLLALGITGSLSWAQGPVSYWTFDEGVGNTAHDYVGGNHGTIFEGEPLWVAGRIGTGLDLDGYHDYVRIPHDPDLDVSSAGLTVCLWIKAGQDQHVNPYAPYFLIIDKSHTGADETAWVMQGGLPGGLGFMIGYGSYVGPPSYGYPGAHIGDSTLVLDNQWHHLAGTFNGSDTIKLYVDGVLQATNNNYTGTPTPNTRDVSIGAWGGGYNNYFTRYFNGIVDEVQIYNRDLSADEIAALQTSGNSPPAAMITWPSSGLVEAVNVPVGLVGGIDDPDVGDTHSATWTISSENWAEPLVFDGTVTGDIVSDEIEFADAGIYSIKLTVTDASGASGEATTVNDDPESPAFVVIYDADGGFVTGGGWIYSEQGAYTPDPTLEGRANFGFVSKYTKGASTPTGNTEFVFKAADLNFHSNSYDWLVVNQAGANAQFKGAGTINNSDYCKFMLWAEDDAGGDTFRIKIWKEIAEVEQVIYDNGFDQPIAGGSIIVHKSKN